MTLCSCWLISINEETVTVIKDVQKTPHVAINVATSDYKVIEKVGGDIFLTYLAKRSFGEKVTISDRG